MRHVKPLILKNYFFLNWFFIPFNLFFIKKNLLFFLIKKSLIIYLKIFFIKKNKKKLKFLFFLKKHNKIINLSFLLLQKLKLNLYSMYSKSETVLLLKGRGFRLISSESSLLILKLGFTHNVNFKYHKKLKTEILSKNAQKFKIIGNLIYVIQVLACLNFIKKKNLFTSKGIFFISEKIKLKNSTKSAW